MTNIKIENGIPKIENGVPNIKIDNGVPVSRLKGFNSAGVKYPLAEMRAGDSFFLPCGDSNGEVSRCRSKVLSAARYAGIAITSRRLANGIRFWRLDE